MKYLDGNYYLEVKDHRYNFHPTENIILRLRDPPNFLRIQYQVQNETQIRKNQKVIENDNDQLVVKNYPTNKQPIQHQPKYKPPNCPTCKRNNWLEFDKGYYCRNCKFIINKQKHQIDEKVLRQERDFSTGLNYGNKKIREIWMKIVNTTYNSTEDMINKLQELERKTKMKFYKIISIYYNIMIIRFDEDTFAKNAQGNSKIYHQVLMLMKILQTKPQVKQMNNSYFDLYYTVIKNRNEKDNQYEKDYIIFNDYIIPNHNKSIKPRETTLR